MESQADEKCVNLSQDAKEDRQELDGQQMLLSDGNS